MLETFTVETFSRHLGETFRLDAGQPAPLELELIQVTDPGRESAKSSDGSGSRAPFSILFRGPGDVILPQRIYRLEHDEMSSFDLFLVPVGPDQAGQRYEAVFT